MRLRGVSVVHPLLVGSIRSGITRELKLLSVNGADHIAVLKNCQRIWNASGDCKKTFGTIINAPCE